MTLNLDRCWLLWMAPTSRTKCRYCKAWFTKFNCSTLLPYISTGQTLRTTIIIYTIYSLTLIFQTLIIRNSEKWSILVHVMYLKWVRMQFCSNVFIECSSKCCAMKKEAMKKDDLLKIYFYQTKHNQRYQTVLAIKIYQL